MKHLVIIGAGDLGREMFWHAQESIGYNIDFDIKGYIDDVYFSESDSEKYRRLQLPVISTIENYFPEKDDVFISAIGSAAGRETTVSIIKKRGGKFFNIINRTSIIHGSVKLGEGIFIGPYTVIGDSVELKDHVMLNTHSAVGHDAIIGEYTCVMSYVDITGWCKIGKRVYIASGARMTPSTKIGDDAYVGIGSVVLRRVKAGAKVFGNPAKKIDV